MKPGKSALKETPTICRGFAIIFYIVVMLTALAGIGSNQPILFSRLLQLAQDKRHLASLWYSRHCRLCSGHFHAVGAVPHYGDGHLWEL